MAKHVIRPMHVNAGVVFPFVKFQQEMGEPVDKSLQRCGMPILDYEGATEEIAEPPFWKFIDYSARKLAVEEFGLEVAEHTRLEDGGLDGILVSQASVWSALVHFCRLENEICPDPHYWMQRDGDTSWICRGAHTLMTGSRNVELYCVYRLVEIVRLLTGLDFGPDLIKVQTQDARGLPKFSFFQNSRIVSDSPITAIAIPHKILLLAANQVGKDNFLSEVRAHIQSLEINQFEHSIDLIAELMRTSRRTLQRKLSDRKVNFRLLFDEYIFIHTSQRLLEEGCTVADIADELGYVAPGNLVRSFRRIAGVPPKIYRQMMLAE